MSEGTGQRRMRIARGVAKVTDGALRAHAGNLRALMDCDVARELAESRTGERKSAPIEEWRASSGLGKPCEQTLRTLCAMGEMSRVRKKAKGSDSPRKVWHYGFMNAERYYSRVPGDQWPTRGGVTVDAEELYRYGGAWDVREREWVDEADWQAELGLEPFEFDARTLAVGIACGRYVTNPDGTVSLTGWGATTEPVAADADGTGHFVAAPPVVAGRRLELRITSSDGDAYWLAEFAPGRVDNRPAWSHGDGDPPEWHIYPGHCVVLDAAGREVGRVTSINPVDRADPDHARAAFAEMRGEAQYASTIEPTVDGVAMRVDDRDEWRETARALMRAAGHCMVNDYSATELRNVGVEAIRSLVSESMQAIGRANNARDEAVEQRDAARVLAQCGTFTPGELRAVAVCCADMLGDCDIVREHIGAESGLIATIELRANIGAALARTLRLLAPAE